MPEHPRSQRPIKGLNDLRLFVEEIFKSLNYTDVPNSRHVMMERYFRRIMPDASEDEIQRELDDHIRFVDERARSTSPGCLNITLGIGFVVVLIVLIFAGILLVGAAVTEGRAAYDSFWETPVGEAIVYALLSMAVVSSIFLWVKRQVTSPRRRLLWGILLTVIAVVIGYLVLTGSLDLENILQQDQQEGGFE